MDVYEYSHNDMFLFLSNITKVWYLYKLILHFIFQSIMQYLKHAISGQLIIWMKSKDIKLPNQGIPIN